MQRALQLAALAVLAFAAAPCLRAASTPAILRTDAFIATQYDANTALVFFNSAVMPAGLGVPVGAWPGVGQQNATQWTGLQAILRLVRSGEESQWGHYWPGGVTNAPHVGGLYALALGGNKIVHGTLSNIGYLPVCDTTWLVGLVTVDALDRGRYASGATNGMVAYQTLPQSVKSSGEHDAGAPAAEVTVGNGRVLNVFPLAALPMLDQGDRDDNDQKILLTEEHGAEGVTYSLKRWTPGSLLPVGIFFANRCKLSSAQ